MKPYLLSIIFLFNQVYAQQKVGINTINPTEALDINGNTNVRGLIKLNGTAGNKGQVLTSQGLIDEPVWKNSAYTDGGRFWTTISNSVRTGIQTPSGRGVNWVLNNSTENTQEDSIDFGAVFIDGTDLSVSNQGILNNFITINKSGLYHFEGVLRMFVTGDADGLQMSPRSFMKIALLKQGLVNTELYLEEELMQLTAQPSTGFSNKSFNTTIQFNIDLHFNAGTTVSFIGGFNQLRMSSSIPLIAMGFTTGGYISGHFMAD